MIVRDSHYIDGRWSPSTSSNVLEVVDAATEQVIGSSPDGTAQDVDQAVAAARRAFPDWAAADPGDRASMLERVAAHLEKRSDELAELVAHELGMPKWL